ncbi:DUF1302 family protein [Thauera sp. Sel9]|uniref:DUF1302 family protein n=1 Tax=Thauera sp. Sel9 TaxID=2974299 RepID=UPI0021E150D3|nr:DUF1302 family protein [Thauera sp. Sel9]MCV2217510.1 hypothetical protein [Thauera sp. Sel9]
MSLIRRTALALACASFMLSGFAAEQTVEDAELDALLDIGTASESGSGVRLSGYGELGAAYTYADDERWSRLRARLELAASGRLGERARWKLSARTDADGAFDLEDDYYPSAVRRDQRRDAILREAWVDFGAGDWEFRLGRQHIIWGEMVGFFFADVVSARDMRDFLLPELEAMRIAQWAARAEYFGGETHFEMIWIPSPSYDDIGKPGSDFYMYPRLPAGARVKEREPSDSLSNSNWGLRVSRLIGGWDISAFYYRSSDITPTLGLNPATMGLELTHERIRQIGGTFSKDMGSFVLKGEAVHTSGRSLSTFLEGGRIGLEKTDMLDYAFGVDVPYRDVWRLNLQYFARWLDRHDERMGFDREERGVTFQVVREIGSTVELELLAAASLNRSDYMLRPKLSWKFAPEWRATAGMDIFHGPQQGMFGRFDERDRVYMEVRRWF